MRWLTLAAFLFSAVSGNAAPPLPCTSTAERLAIPIPAADSETGDDRFAEVYGAHEYRQDLPYGWQFALVSADAGWTLRVFDRPEPEGQIDLTAVTPPFMLPVNPRDLFGWHFRSDDNTRVNTGELNAPQQLRLFQFEPALTGTGGFRPPREALSSSATELPEAPGRGWLRILDMGLSDLSRGEQARMTYLKFQACLTLPQPSIVDEQQWASALAASRSAIDAANPHYSDADREQLGACLRGMGDTELAARVLPRLLSLDIDGDNALDIVVQTREPATDERGILLCRAGTWAHAVEDTADVDVQQIVRALEAWKVLPVDSGALGYVDEPAWPKTAGDVLLIERVEKGAAIVYWQDGSLRARSLFRMVEP